MRTPQTIEQLNQQFALAQALRFEPGEGGLIRAVVRTGSCSGSVYLHGAHVAAYQPTGHQPVLFMSSRSAFAEGKPIRGGVPVCFPWFGPHPGDASAPAHGPARLAAWQVQQTSADGEVVSIQLAATFDPFHVVHRVTFGRELVMTLRVDNQSSASATFEAALHTYFAVADARKTSVSGLEHVEYLDKVDAGKRKRQGGEAITFTGETDRVYVDTRSACVLTDPALGRRITIAKTGSDTTVVWNPWINKAKAMPDFGDDEWTGMVCIETANAGPNAVTLKAGSVHEMSATISVEAM